MKSYCPSKKDLSKFNIKDIKTFLNNENWELSEENKKYSLYVGPKLDSGKHITFFIPNSEENIDYYDRIADLISLISHIKEMDPSLLIDTLTTINNDILRMRIINPGDYKYSIPLDVAAIEIDALKRLFTYGACSEEYARPFFDKPTTIGIKHSNQCQFGHTFEGSFGFTINSPIITKENEINQGDLFESQSVPQIPFERKVMERIATGFFLIKNAIEENDISIIVNNFETGFNSKMLDAIIDISLEKSKKVEFSFHWSNQIIPSNNLASFKGITLYDESYEMIKEASNDLKKIEPFTENIIGKIITLHSNKSPFSDENFPRIAIIKHCYDNHNIEVKLELNKEQYKKAYEAHGDGRTLEIKGKLYKKGQTWRMFDIVDINFFRS